MKRLFLIMTTLLIVGSAWGQTTVQRRQLWVKNYRNVHVWVDVTDAAKLGITEADIRTKVELRLREANIRPLEKSMTITTISEDMPTLKIDLTILDSAFHVHTEFLRIVRWTLPNEANVAALVATWEDGLTGTSGQDRSYVLSAIDTEMDQFLNEYLKENQPL